MSSFKIVNLEREEFFKYFNTYRHQVFGKDHSYHLWDILSEQEIEDIEKLKAPYGVGFNLYYAAFDENDNFAGWAWGFQENQTTFYMCNSAVLENYRRQGLYTMLLNKTLEEVKAKGFQLVYSRHCATNNDVIIPKLKAGFLISKMEISDSFGVLIHLHYYTNATRKKIMDYRSGQIAPDEELKKIFKI